MSWILFVGGVAFLVEGMLQSLALDLWRAGISLAVGALLLDAAWRRTER